MQIKMSNLNRKLPQLGIKWNWNADVALWTTIHCKGYDLKLEKW